jgi:hypothetical protein
MTYHYVVSFTGAVVAVYGKALREHAFESASKHRANGVACEVFTRDGERLSTGEQYKNEAL